jgi:chromosomal replication initiation ATPase DnaA
MKQISELITESIEITGISYEDIISKNRQRDIVCGRWHAWKLLREKGELTYQSIGRLFGTDHATVLVGIRKINMFIDTNQISFNN